MSYIIKQIANILNDAVEDAIGVSSVAQQLDTTDFTSMGKAIDDYDLYDGFFSALTNRLVKTVYFVRQYKANTRNILRDENEYGAFIQKVYYKMPDNVDNPTYGIPDGSGTYGQASPYDVETPIAVSALIFGGQGTWSIEVVRPIAQIKTAFLDMSSMMRFIDGIYVEIENKFKLDEERLVATAVNTAMASSLSGGVFRNLLAEFNANHPDDTLTVAQCLESADFLKYASKEIKETIEHMGSMSVAFNKNGYETFSNKDNLIVEMLSHFASASDMYLQADTFHNELVKLPNFDKVSFWQSSGKKFAFADCSKINIKNEDLISTDNPTGEVVQGGIICFVHDIENVAAYFGERYTWEEVNKRQRLVIHGEQARKGYAVDNNANAVVFYIAEAGSLTIDDSDAHITSATANTESVVRGEEIILTVVAEEGYTPTVSIDSSVIEAGTDGKYHYVPQSEDDITIVVTSSSSTRARHS